MGVPNIFCNKVYTYPPTPACKGERALRRVLELQHDDNNNNNNNNNNNDNNNNNNNNNSNLFAKPCCSPAAEVSFLNGFFDAERRNLLVHGIAASRYWNHVKTVGLWA